MASILFIEIDSSKSSFKGILLDNSDIIEFRFSYYGIIYWLCFRKSLNIAETALFKQAYD